MHQNPLRGAWPDIHWPFFDPLVGSACDGVDNDESEKGTDRPSNRADTPLNRSTALKGPEFMPWHNDSHFTPTHKIPVALPVAHTLVVGTIATPPHPATDMADAATADRRDAANSAWERFQQAGIEPRRRQVDVSTFLRNEPLDKKSTAWLQWRVACIIEGPTGQKVVCFCVLLNSIIIGVESDWESDSPAWAWLDYGFAIIFAVDMSMRLFGLGWIFWQDHWNLLDLTIVGVSLIELIQRSFSGYVGASAFRLIRVVKIVRLIGMLEVLSSLAEAFILAVNHVLSVGVMIFVLFYMFAGKFTIFRRTSFDIISILVLARQLFGELETLAQNPEYNSEWFSSVPNSLLTLFQLMTMVTLPTPLLLMPTIHALYCRHELCHSG